MNNEWKSWWGPKFQEGDLVKGDYKGKECLFIIASKHDPWDFRGWWYVDLESHDYGRYVREGAELTLVNN